MLDITSVALVACACVHWVSAARPAEHTSLPLAPQGPQGLEGGVDNTTTWRSLPKSCGPDGIIRLDVNMTYKTDPGSHIIIEECRVLQGAAGVRIFLFGGVVFQSIDVEVEGPFTLTLAPGIKSINSSALRGAQSMRVVSPDGSKMVFKDLTFTCPCSVLKADRGLALEGPGRMEIENVLLDRYAAVSTTGHVNVTVANLVFRNCSATAGSGTAIYGVFGVHLGSNGSILFDRCHSAWRGGAVASQRSIRITGRGNYMFKRCSSAHRALGGGAVSSLASTELDLLPGGSVVFQQCSALGEGDGGSGGAIYSAGDIYVKGGAVKFDGCHAKSGFGDALSAPRGIVHISQEAQVEFANKVGSGSNIFGRDVEIPIDGTLHALDIFETEDLLVAKSQGSGNDTCPAGSRFRLDDDSGIPIPGQCRFCGSGTASLAPSRMNISDKVVPAAGLRIVLVRRNSANAIHDFVSVIGNKSHVYDSSALGIALDAYSDEWKTRRALVFSTVNKTAFNFDGQVFQSYIGNNRLQLSLKDATRTLFPGVWVGWCSGSCGSRAMFRENSRDGTISPERSPGLVLGVSHEAKYTYDPPNPYGACVPCDVLAAESADKLKCPGGARVASLNGHMLMHEVGNRTLDVHRCPNRAACPGSNLTLTPEGELSNLSSLCATGYKKSPGCVKCAAGYGRPQLDAFTCQACGTASLAQQVGMALLSNGVFYALALNAAKPRTETQQIFKVFLAFLTVSCRSLSAVLHTEHYGRLKRDALSIGRTVYRCLFAVDLVVASEPGAGTYSFDCWGVADGAVDVFLNLCLSWAVPSMLFLLSIGWFGPGNWLKCLVVWGNVFVPPLFGAVARLTPCYSTQASHYRILMYEAAKNTACASTLGEMLPLPRFWAALATGTLLLLLGPVLWFYLAANRKRDQQAESFAFLVAGYRPLLPWWEITVLIRKVAIFVVATWFPMSFAPGAHLLYLLVVMIVAELVHVSVRPYTSDFLNRLEAQALGISSLCLVLVCSLLVEWPFMPYAVYVTSCGLLFMLTAGVYIYFLCLYVQAARGQVDDEDEGDQDPQDDDAAKEEAEVADTASDAE